MVLTKTLLDQRLEILRAQLTQLEANAHAVQGAIQTIQQLQQELELPEPPPVEG